MNNLSSAVGLYDDGFTLLPAWVSFPAVTSTVSVGRQGLSIQDSRQHQGEIPARQLLKVCGGLQNFWGVGVAHDCIVFFLRAFETATDGNTR